NVYFTGYFYGARDRYVLVGKLSADGAHLPVLRGIGGQVPGPGDQNADSSGDGIAVDASGNIYVTGYTRAADFPTTVGAYRRTIEAFEDGFVTKLDPSGATYLYSTYIPGGVSEYPSDLVLDSGGQVYVTGT